MTSGKRWTRGDPVCSRVVLTGRMLRADGVECYVFAPVIGQEIHGPSRAISRENFKPLRIGHVYDLATDAPWPDCGVWADLTDYVQPWGNTTQRCEWQEEDRIFELHKWQREKEDLGLIRQCREVIDWLLERTGEDHPLWGCDGPESGCYTEYDTNAGIHSEKCPSEYYHWADALSTSLGKRLEVPNGGH